MLIVEDDLSFVNILKDMAREKGFKVPGGDPRRRRPGDGAALSAGRHHPRHQPAGTWTAGRVLDRLKHDPATRHIPVHIISLLEEAHRGMRLGAMAHLAKPVEREALEAGLHLD